MKYGSAFEEWLYAPQPNWKVNLESCDPEVFRKLKIRKERVEKILEVLEENGVFKEPKSGW